MDVILQSLSHGFAVTFHGYNFLILSIGCAVGLFVGAMPGLGSVNGVAILLPVTFLMGPTTAIMFLAAIYYGAMFGGSISSILLGIPGASTAVATTFDGRPMAVQGRAVQALMTSATASFYGGTIGVLLFTLIAPPLASFALRFGPPENFTLMLLAFATFIGLGGDDVWKTIFSTAFGLLCSAVGLDTISGQPRLIFFNLPGFYHGINFLVLAIGLYGIGEILWTIQLARGKVTMTRPDFSTKAFKDGLRCLKQGFGNMNMGAFLGYVVGILPAAGATPGSLMAYGIAKTLSRNPERYGKGEARGVAAPESANNAASTGSMLPMLTLGIPGSPTTAVLLGGMFIWGLTPGPMLFSQEPDFVWGLISSLYVSNVVSAVLMVVSIPLFLAILRLPFSVLAPMIYILCITGGYAPTNTMHDVWLMVGFGLGGFLLRKLEYPMAPAALAIVLGPLTERNFRQALIGSQGDFSVFFSSTISLSFIACTVLLLALPAIKSLLSRRRSDGASAAH
jgi:putative tricarboxylic transport membrane protein